MYPRYSEQTVQKALDEKPVVFVMGPRQTGKTTLLKSLLAKYGSDEWTYLSLDDKTQYKSARSDPVGYIRNLPSTRIALESIDRLPELIEPIKQAVAERPSSGRFLLTGSSNDYATARAGDSREDWIKRIRLSTLSEYEIQSRQPGFLVKLLNQEVPTTRITRVRTHLLSRLVMGFFPEPMQFTSENKIQDWYRQYVNALIKSDIKELPHIDYPDLMLKLLKLTASYSGKLINLSEMGSKLGVDRLTVKKYLALLEQMFLIEQVPAWQNSEYKRLIKTPKIQLVDTGMMCAMRGLNHHQLNDDPELYNVALKSFVYNKIRKQATWVQESTKIYHYRDKDSVEVDCIIEDANGGCYAVHSIAGATLHRSAIAALKRFRNIAGDCFKTGLLLYDGDQTTALGDELYAVPLGALWS